MLAGPHQDGIFKGGRAEDESKEPQRPGSLKGDVREKPMVAEADAEATGAEQGEKKRDLKPVEPENPQINRKGGKCEHERADQERARGPVDTMGGELKNHGFTTARGR